MLKNIILLIILSTYNTFANDIVMEVKKTLTIEGDNQEIYSLDSRSDIGIQLTNSVKDEGHLWYRTISLVDENGQRVDNRTYKVSSSFLYKSIAVSSAKSFQAQNGNRTITIPPGVNVVIDSRGGTNWKYYNIYLVNQDGQIVDENGNLQRDPRNIGLYKVSESVFNQILLDQKIGELTNILQDFDDSVLAPNYGCIQTDIQLEQNGTPSVPTTPPLTRTPARQSSQRDRQAVSTYDYLMSRRNALKGRPNCLSQLRRLEEGLPNPLWKNLSLEQRADEIYNEAKKTFEKVLAYNQTQVGRTNATDFNQRANPHYIHPALSPELMSCIVFQETHGILRPQVYNYTYCENNSHPTSTAHGLGMITGRTLRQLHNYRKTPTQSVNQVPIVTIPGNPYAGQSAQFLHKAMADDVPLTMEVLFRTLNDNLKQQSWSLAGRSGFNQNSTADTLKYGVSLYDQDSKSSYLNGVLRKCLPCMQSVGSGTGSPIQCHNGMKR